jgi:hypothetical protein
MLAIHLKAKNDVNGNPRRCYVVCNPEVIDVIDEEYRGVGALEKYPNIPIIEFETTLKQYRELTR